MKLNFTLIIAAIFMAAQVSAGVVRDSRRNSSGDSKDGHSTGGTIHISGGVRHHISGDCHCESHGNSLICHSGSSGCDIESDGADADGADAVGGDASAIIID